MELGYLFILAQSLIYPDHILMIKHPEDRTWPRFDIWHWGDGLVHMMPEHFNLRKVVPNTPENVLLSHITQRRDYINLLKG